MPTGAFAGICRMIGAMIVAVPCPPMPTRSVASVVSATLRSRNWRTSTIGSRTRRSHETQATQAASPTAIDPITDAFVQPQSPAWVRPNSTKAVAGTRSTAPTMSIDGRGLRPGVRGRPAHAISDATTPMAVAAMNSTRHPPWSSSTPAIRPPAPAEIGTMPPSSAIASGTRRSGSSSRTRPKEMGRAPAARPCAPRPRTTIHRSVASTLISEPQAAARSSSARTLRRPKMSPSRPPVAAKAAPTSR
ncbi:hypothetical protein BJF79_15395 [Actinomadura sp. CNU-125]|nr:hypothetical protein [Actinomadura sp. CNU-125]OLT21652.1 hypothetical protein BJF79_15395 [Actinomadura sp. CNU-125]